MEAVLIVGSSAHYQVIRIRMVNGRFSSRSVVFKIDTGADITAISKSTFDTLPNQSMLHPFKIDEEIKKIYVIQVSIC